MLFCFQNYCLLEHHGDCCCDWGPPSGDGCEIRCAGRDWNVKKKELKNENHLSPFALLRRGLGVGRPEQPPLIAVRAVAGAYAALRAQQTPETCFKLASSVSLVCANPMRLRRCVEERSVRSALLFSRIPARSTLLRYLLFSCFCHFFRTTINSCFGPDYRLDATRGQGQA